MLPQNNVEILKRLNKNDLKKLRDFINSPYFNTKKNLCILYNEIAKEYPELEPGKFDYKRIYKKIYGTGNYKEQTIRNLYAMFGVLLKKFIVHERIESVEPEYNRALIDGLKDRACYELSNKTIVSLKKQNLKSFESEDDYYYDLFHLNQTHDFNINMSGKYDINLSYENKKSIMYNISIFYLSTLFFLAQEESLITKPYGLKKEASIHTTIIKTFEETDFFKSENNTLYPAFVKIRFLFYKYAENNLTEKDYLELEKMVMDYIDEFTDHFKILCWINLTSLILWKLVALDKKYYRDAFRLNDFFCNLGLFPNKTNYAFAAALFRNTFDTAITLKEYDWAQNFIDKFSPYLEDGIRANEINYSLGRLNFKLNKYEDSLGFLNKVIYDTVREKINTKFYFLMNYIELKAYQSAFSMVSAIKQFSNESKELSEFFSTLIEPSLKFFREIIRAEENNKKIDYSILKEAQNVGRFYHKQYILEKMEGLI